MTPDEHLLAFLDDPYIYVSHNECNPCTMSWAPHWKKAQGSNCTLERPALGTRRESDFRTSTILVKKSGALMERRCWVFQSRQGNTIRRVCHCGSMSFCRYGHRDGRTMEQRGSRFRARHGGSPQPGSTTSVAALFVPGLVYPYACSVLQLRLCTVSYLRQNGLGWH